MKKEWEVQILVNGEEIRLKDFPRRVIYNLILGFVKSLKLEEDPRDIEIRVRLGEKENTGDP
ncbi:hypothetical protein [Thermocrinis sp.]